MRQYIRFFLQVLGISLFPLVIVASEESHSVGLFDPSKEMVLWTWVTFALLLAVLSKFAWKPILAAIDQREADIRQSVENAEKIQKEMVGLEEKQKKILLDAEDKAKFIITTAKKTAIEMANRIEEKSREESKILLENTHREIKTAHESAEASLRRESAELAIRIASKLIGENLDEEKNRALANRLITQI